MPTPLYFNYQDLRFNSNLQALEYNSGNEVWVEVPVPTGTIGLTNGKILVGNASNIATPVTMSGGATISNAGVVTLAAPALTTLHTFAGVAGVATDNSILQIDVANTAVGVNVAPAAGIALKVHGIITCDNVISATGEVGTSAGFVVPGGGYIRSSGSQLVLRPTSDITSSIILQNAAQGSVVIVDTVNGSMSVGGTVPNTKSILDLQSTTLGMLPPRMTNTQRDAITSPPEGLTIYSTSDHALEFYNGSTWKVVATV